jgi:cytochrome P450
MDKRNDTVIQPFRSQECSTARDISCRSGKEHDHTHLKIENCEQGCFAHSLTAPFEEPGNNSLHESANHRIKKNRSIPKLPMSLWLLGSSHEFTSDPATFLEIQHNAKGDILDLNIPFLDKRISIIKPEYIRHVLVDNHKNYIKDKVTRKLQLALGKGLLTNEGESWKRQRQLAQPAFNSNSLASLFQYIVQTTSDYLKDWDVEGTTVDIVQEMARLTSAIAAKSFFGVSLDDSTQIWRSVEQNNDFLTRQFKRPLNFPLWIPTAENRAFIQARSELHSFIREIISKRRALINLGETEINLMSLLLDSQEQVTDQVQLEKQLVDECVTLFIAGHETSANALAWTWYLLGQHADVLERVNEEMQSVVGMDAPTLSDIGNLVYTKQVIQESMRLYPPAWMIGREALADDRIGGYEIKKGAQVLICSYAVHRNKGLWTNPHRFDPERFSPRHRKDHKKYSYIPFGGGPRFCIGSRFAMLEIQVILIMLLQRYRPVLAKHEVELDPLITLRPRNGVQMQFVPVYQA